MGLVYYLIVLHRVIHLLPDRRGRGGLAFDGHKSFDELNSKCSLKGGRSLKREIVVVL